MAAAIETSLTWTTDVPASVGVISINFATDSDVVMSTTSVTGQALCIADHIDGSDFGTYYGRIDAHGASDATSCAISGDPQT